MNYYNPYIGLYPYALAPTRTGLLSSLFRGRSFNLSSIISGTQKTLNIINQTIPVIKQVSPVMKNAKTMFRVMNEFKKTDTPKKTDKKTDVPKDTSAKEPEESSYNNTNFTNDFEPTFFV